MGDRGEVTTTVIMVPVVLLTVIMVVQFGLAYHARTVLSGAANDGAAAAARDGSSPSVGAALTDQLIEEAAGSLLVSYSSVGSGDGSTVSVEATGEVVSLLPFFGTIMVRATGSAKVESFDPQGRP